MQKDAPKPPIDPRAVAYLQPIYAPELVALEAELGRPLPELRRSWAAAPHPASPPVSAAVPTHRSVDVVKQVHTEGAIDH